MPKRGPTLTVPAELQQSIAALNEQWMAQGMPKRCRLPTKGNGWRRVVRLLPGYDPIASAPPGCTFDVERAVHAIAFFHGYLRHIKGSLGGQPFWLEPWQQALVGNLFGWRIAGLRRYREFLLWIGRKNGKTTLAAGIQLYVMLEDGEPGAEVYCAAGDKQQAGIIFGLAKAMVLSDPDLSRRLRVLQYSITDEATDSIFRVLSADAKLKHGLSAQSFIVDELHVQPDAELVDTLKTSTGAREQPLFGYITTADYDRPSVCNSTYDYAVSVRDGTLDDPTFLPAIFEAHASDDPHAEQTWRTANPNYGVSLLPQYMKRESDRAKADPSYLFTFLRLHLNIRTATEQRWLDPVTFDACNVATLEREPGTPAYIGVDLSSTEDLTAMAAAWRVGEQWQTRLRFWMPEANIDKRERRDRVPLSAWIRAGELVATPGERIDYDLVLSEVLEWCHELGVQSPAIDRWNAEMPLQWLTKAGLEPLEYAQSMANISSPARLFESLIATGQIRLGGSPVLGWMARNAVVRLDGNEGIRPEKKLSRDRIDGLLAIIMALGCAIHRDNQPKAKSVYETRGFHAFGQRRAQGATA